MALIILPFDWSLPDDLTKPAPAPTWLPRNNALLTPTVTAAPAGLPPGKQLTTPPQPAPLPAQSWLQRGLTSPASATPPPGKQLTVPPVPAPPATSWIWSGIMTPASATPPPGKQLTTSPVTAVLTPTWSPQNLLALNVTVTVAPAAQPFSGQLQPPQPAPAAVSWRAQSLLTSTLGPIAVAQPFVNLLQLPQPALATPSWGPQNLLATTLAPVVPVGPQARPFINPLYPPQPAPSTVPWSPFNVLAETLSSVVVAPPPPIFPFANRLYPPQPAPAVPFWVAPRNLALLNSPFTKKKKVGWPRHWLTEKEWALLERLGYVAKVAEKKRPALRTAVEAALEFIEVAPALSLLPDGIERTTEAIARARKPKEVARATSMMLALLECARRIEEQRIDNEEDEMEELLLHGIL